MTPPDCLSVEGRVFTCPKCGYRTVQEDIVKGCSHYCPENRGRLVVLVRERA